MQTVDNETGELKGAVRKMVDDDKRGRGKNLSEEELFPGAGELERGVKKEKCNNIRTVMETKIAGFFSAVTYFEHWAA